MLFLCHSSSGAALPGCHPPDDDVQGTILTQTASDTSFGVWPKTDLDTCGNTLSTSSNAKNIQIKLLEMAKQCGQAIDLIQALTSLFGCAAGVITMVITPIR